MKKPIPDLRTLDHKARMERRRIPRQSRSENTLTSILQAAVALAEKEGFAALTTPRIAEKAGVSIGSLYQYFPNREAIYATLYDSASTRCAVAVRALMLRMVNEPPDRGMRAMVAGVLKVCEENSLILLTLVSEVPAMRERITMLSSFESLVRASIKLYLQTHLPKSGLRHNETQLLLLESAIVHAIQRFALERPPLVLRSKLINDLADIVVAFIEREGGERAALGGAIRSSRRKRPVDESAATKKI